MSMQEYTSVLLIAAILFAGILVASPFSAVAQEEQPATSEYNYDNDYSISGKYYYIFSSAIIRNTVVAAANLPRKSTTWNRDSN